jgi:hypothetical protein
MPLGGIKLIGLVSALLGFLGAGLFYFGFDLQSHYVCPLCPYVDGANVHPALTFARLTAVIGALNALFYFVVGLVVWVMVKGARQLVHKAWPHPTK